jgi:hypothetical protein
VSGEQLEEAAAALLARAAEISSGPLEGIEEAAKELAGMTGGDLRVLERARRLALDAERSDPGRLSLQVVSLIRRAIEVGTWDWDAH